MRKGGSKCERGSVREGGSQREGRERGVDEG